MLPIDKAALGCPELVHLIDYLERFDAGDGVRCLSQILVDAGAWKHPVDHVDPLPEDIIETPPSLKFRVMTAKADGWIEYRYDRGLDCFGMYLTDAAGTTVRSETRVFFEQLAEITSDWIDDGSWRIAKVEILKPAPRKARAA